GCNNKKCENYWYYGHGITFHFQGGRLVKYKPKELIE
ncbi:unnamed protein product, partial [marine sediment metagenome]